MSDPPQGAKVCPKNQTVPLQDWGGGQRGHIHRADAHREPQDGLQGPPGQPLRQEWLGGWGGGEQSGVGMEGTGWVMSSNSVPILQNRTTPTSVGHWQDRQLSHGGTILLSQELTGVTGNVGIAASWFL